MTYESSLSPRSELINYYTNDQKIIYKKKEIVTNATLKLILLMEVGQLKCHHFYFFKKKDLSMTSKEIFEKTIVKVCIQ